MYFMKTRGMIFWKLIEARKDVIFIDKKMATIEDEEEKSRE